MEKNQKIMLERAAAIAGRKINLNQNAGETLSVVEFGLVPERYAVAERFVGEVLPLSEITPIPGAPAFIMGVINLRGKIVSLVNLKIKFSLKEKGLTDFNKVIILSNENMEFGIVADTIVGNRSISLDSLSPAPLTLDKRSAELVIGISPDGVILLDADRLLKSNQLIVNQK